jgi:hypothetical protein
VTRDESQVSFWGSLALEQVLRDLVKFDLFSNFDILSKEERNMKQRSRISTPFFGSFLGFWDYVMSMGCWPMGLPMFRPIL